MVSSLLHGVNKTRKHWQCCIFQIVFSIPIYPLQRGFYPLKICLIPLNLKRVVYCFTMGVQKKKRTEQIYPQFQNAVGILILTAVLSLNFQASQNREKKRLYIQAHKIPLQSDVPVHKSQHWFHPECQDIKLKACQLKHSRTVGCFECWLKWKLACSNWVNVINLF